MKKKGLKLKILFVVVCVVTGVAVALFISDRKATYNHAEKYTVAMGTVMTQKVYADIPGSNITEIIELVNGLEDIISYKDAGSTLTALNTDGTVISDTITQVLRICKDVSEKSGGAFDVTVGEVSDLWGIGTENARIPTEQEIAEAIAECGYENISVDGITITLNGDYSIDLGAIGKGLACDYIMSYLKSSSEIKGAVVSVGGSIVVYGEHNKAGDGWRVAIRHPRNQNEYLGVITLHEGFVSTSGDYEKYFEQDGVRYHHILDGNTGYPADSSLISVTVVCDSGILSDALSTACFILGREKGEELLLQYGAAGIFVDENMNISIVGDIDFEY